MNEYVPAFVRALDLIGILAFALSGGWLALRRGLDLVGVTALAVTAALFGGLIRDILIGELPPQLVTDDLYLIVVLAAVLLVIALPGLADRRFRTVLVLDAIGLGMFAAIGGSKAVFAGLGLIGATFVGTIAAVGGGIVRDILAAGVPQVFKGESELYVVPAAAGALAAALAADNGRASLEVLILCAAMTAAIRLLAVRYGWHAPVPSWFRRGQPRLDEGQP